MDTHKRKYEDALERAIIAHKDEDRHLKATLEGIFPELKKYEDEWMCNIAINACKYMMENFENSTKQYEEAIAWLEKQGEKKPAWNEKDRDVISHLLTICHGAKKFRQFASCSQEDITRCQDWLTSLKERIQL